ncbi:hypothetical protein OB955_07235 [Halobacteria archaeon AArc-m2/3/4]|uniref:Uncharacterized protein n=1 Tax=Natronoglomus mannanivorans TaxID=2979990 RepID=A0AAP2YXI9_9EURY|nr:hypothetical protein [Halobacteria archaeon AArc-xg1-1]MCU4972530.1 hypothetical protein [Halobacteria archaeon AArc-m2/3/4]
MASEDTRSELDDAVFERDGCTCQYCHDRPDVAELESYAVDPDPMPAGDSPHPASLVTICADCASVLAGTAVTESPETDQALFETVRECTVAQSEAISDVVAFADRGTGLPNALEAGEHDPEAYAASRRKLSVTLDVLEVQLAGLAALDPADFAVDPAAFEAFQTDARRLQSDLREIVATVERVAATLERCHVCLEAVGGDGSGDTAGRCRACSVTRLDASEWRGPDGEIDFDVLFGSINETLQTASKTTERLTGRASDVAESLVG